MVAKAEGRCGFAVEPALDGWLRSGGELAASLPGTRLVYMGDREADLRWLVDLAAETGHAADYLVRASAPSRLPMRSPRWERWCTSLPALAVS